MAKDKTDEEFGALFVIIPLVVMLMTWLLTGIFRMGINLINPLLTLIGTSVFITGIYLLIRKPKDKEVRR